jgi:integrase
MATLRNRNRKWHVQVRRTGHPPRTRSFLSKADAQKWGRKVEAELDAAVIPCDLRILDRTTVRELLLRYRDNVSVNKRGEEPERKRIDLYLRQAWANQPLSRATPQVFSRFRDQRLKTVRPATVARDLALLQAMFEVARQEWDYPFIENPLAKVKKPKAPNGRDRRLQDGELNLLLNASDDNRTEWLRPGIIFAVETGMRRGELLSIRWCDVCFDTSTLLITETKNGHPRRIPLSAEAMQVLTTRKSDDSKPDERIFPVTGNAFRLSWERCRRRVAKTYPAIADLRFHDLRHEAVSRFFEMGLSVPEVALISGHRDPRMLFRYTHLRAEDLVSKINAAGRELGR